MEKTSSKRGIKYFFRLFDSEGEGFIPVLRFREILQEVDEDFTESELDDIIAEVSRLLHFHFFVLSDLIHQF